MYISRIVRLFYVRRMLFTGIVYEYDCGNPRYRDPRRIPSTNQLIYTKRTPFFFLFFIFFFFLLLFVFPIVNDSHTVRVDLFKVHNEYKLGILLRHSIHVISGGKPSTSLTLGLFWCTHHQSF